MRLRKQSFFAFLLATHTRGLAFISACPIASPRHHLAPHLLFRPLRFSTAYTMADADEPAKKKGSKKAGVAVAPSESEEPKAKKVKKEANMDDKIPRSVTGPQPPLPAGRPCLSVATWNVAGLRALTKTPEDCARIAALASAHSIDILCLQETKLQTQHVAEHALLLPGYRSFWLCSETTKGYSGVCVFVREGRVALADSVEASAGSSAAEVAAAAKKAKCAPSSSPPSSSASAGPVTTLHRVSYDISTDPKFSGEGRVITLELDSFFLVNCYVPNAGQNLVRLDYRVGEWDPALRGYLAALQAGEGAAAASSTSTSTSTSTSSGSSGSSGGGGGIPYAPKPRGKPVIFTGDLNVAHTNLDVYNPHAPHLKKQPGCTARERGSHDVLLSGGLVDAFRHFYPLATGCYSYWSGRNVVARAENKVRSRRSICVSLSTCLCLPAGLPVFLCPPPFPPPPAPRAQFIHSHLFPTPNDKSPPSLQPPLPPMPSPPGPAPGHLPRLGRPREQRARLPGAQRSSLLHHLPSSLFVLLSFLLFSLRSAPLLSPLSPRSFRWSNVSRRTS